MLRCTGFFRGIDCPFDKNPAGGRCPRPYCHFRHAGGGGGGWVGSRASGYSDSNNNSNSGGGSSSSSSSSNSSSSSKEGNSRAKTSTAAEIGYDPYNPDLPKVSSRADSPLDDVAESHPGISELELVNKAIEAVRNEVEREQKKYEELLETSKEYGTSEASLLTSESPDGGSRMIQDSFTSLEYNPSVYRQRNKADYNPTPFAAASVTEGSSKYTLDSHAGKKSKNSSMEYVPTTVSHSAKYTPVANKYVIDNSRPPTDLEYDPLSNYSARLLNKANSKHHKGIKRSRPPSQEESYAPPSLKKRCSGIKAAETYAKFSDSEDEVSSEYQPSTLNSLPPKLDSENKLNDESSSTGKILRQEDPCSRELKEIAVQYDEEDIKRSEENDINTKKDTKLPSASKNETSKIEKSKDATKEKVKVQKSESSKSPGHRKTEKSKNPKKEKQEKEEKVKIKNAERNCKEKKKAKTDDCSQKSFKLKPENQKPCSQKKLKSQSNTSVDLEKNKNGKIRKTASMEVLGNSKNSKNNSKLKAVNLINENQVTNVKHKERKEGKSCNPNKPKDNKMSTPEDGKAKGKQKPKLRALTHIDLFGDESGDEEVNDDHSLPVSLLSVSSDSDSGSNTGFTTDNERTKGLKPSNLRSSLSSVNSKDVDYSILEKDLDYDSDPMEECLRIFNESKDIKTEDKGRFAKQTSKEEIIEEKTENTLTTLFPGQKRRISHLTKSASAEAPSKPVIRPYCRPTAQEICYQRTLQAQQQAAQLEAMVQKAALAVPGEKKRIAHIPSAAHSMAAGSTRSPGVTDKTVGSILSSNGCSASSINLKARTLTGMASKTTTTTAQKRIAHAPTLQSTSLKRPIIPTEFGAKVPTNVRQRYLNLFIDECLKFCSSSQEACDKALSEEKIAYDRSSSRNIYLNVAVNTLKKLRTLAPNSPASINKPVSKKLVSHEAVLGGKLAARTSFSSTRSPILRHEDFTGAGLYRKLKEYLLTEEQLKENGYPMPCPEKTGRALLFTSEEKKTSDSSCRVCCRCGSEYMVSASGNCVRKEECFYHWGKLRRQRVPGGWETHYSCCSGPVGSPGCQIAKQHVHDCHKENLEGFVKTFEKPLPADGNPGVYALDCEMCYTKHGLELTRVTVINSALTVVYDTFVKPDSKVVDYNTRFSGVTEDDLNNVKTTLRDVQAVLLSMFSSDTILIGHSLESDLFALKLIHLTVVDTALVFPHRLGLPYKRALRTLMAEHLKRIIQDNVEGHDSSEDACSCMELMIWKIKEDAKVKR
ncbi:RNA exonuclease 1 homolog [Microcaecilia unicolor]|uniref:RNA exonuclease 1 homolog n=1 Tax=Microcaecilia unicolor TaxID=1415580 RepID=A0A6P7ZIZ1_9AMPH|nr:RNA exonuclease 1 homolog [Microcaecilia unicolor]